MSGAEPVRASASGRRWPGVLPRVLVGLTLLGIAAFTWLDVLLRQAGRADLALRADELHYVLAVVLTTTLGAVITTRRPGHSVGLLLLVFGLLLMVDGATDASVRYGLLARPGSLPGVAYARPLGDTFIFLPACVGFVLLLTPTGSLPSPRWRWWARIAAVAPFLGQASAIGVAEAQYPLITVPNAFYVPALATPAAVVGFASVTVTLLSVAVGGVSLVVRFRRARGVEREQLRWVAFAAALAVVGALVAVAGVQVDSALLVGGGLVGAAVVLFLAIGAAVLRYRLYDLDRIISRTLAYGLLTVLLGACYAVGVLALGPALGPLLGRGSSSPAVAVATLAVAAAFQPARRWIQGLVERRFNRSRYDAQRTIAAFSGRLRQQTDLDALTTELLSVVDQTMQPTRAALWLRPAADRGGGAFRGPM